MPETEAVENTATPKAVCQCGAEIEWQEEAPDRGDWVHTRIEDGSHEPTPLTNQPPAKGHPNYRYLMDRFEEELAGEEHLKQGLVEKRVEEYDAHVREIEAPGYMPPELAEQDTLAEWIHNRQRKQNIDMQTPWSELHVDDVAYWQHEAQAYRRAVARGGFKNYDPLLGDQ